MNRAPAATLSQMLDRAVGAHRAGDLATAEQAYQQILRLDGRQIDARHLLGVVRQQQGDYAGALEEIGRAFELGGRSASIHSNLGIVLRELGQLTQAESHLRKAVNLSPETAGFHYNLANCLRDTERSEEALQFYRDAIRVSPDFADAQNNLGHLLCSMGRPDEAENAFRHALRLRPDFAEASFGLASLCRSQERLDDAIGHYRHAVGCRPAYLEAWVNLGYTQEDLGRIPEAVAAYESAIGLNPDSADAHFNRALAWLRAGDYERGWKEYEWRLKKRNETLNPGDWDGWNQLPRPIESIAIPGEQGIGDEVMFASCLSEIAGECRRCVASCDTRLLPLFKRSFPAIEFHPRDTGREQRPRCSDGTQPSLTIPIGSLPRLLGRNATNFPKHNGYLTPHAGLVNEWRSRYSELGAGLVVGISWRGGRDATVRRRRSIPVKEWQPVWTVPGVSFVNLQYGTTPDEIASFGSAHGRQLHDWNDADPLVDLDGFVAQISALDLVISTDNATVHLAGGLGKPVWTLLPYSCDWRWGIAVTRSPWYPEMRLFRQNSPQDWQAVMQQAAKSLAELSAV